MTVTEKYHVESINKSLCDEWLIYKHYARRVPPIMFSFGLYDNENKMRGVCTYGPPCRYMNNGYAIFGGVVSVQTVELNRLCVNDGLEKNVLSFFVAQTLTMLPKPMCVVSYADANNGHHGYIYQSTNWIYTGITNSSNIYFNTRTGKQIHQRTIFSMFGSGALCDIPPYIEVSSEESGKYRYFQFLGTKNDVKNMKKYLKYKIEQYPKGENKRYDSSYITTNQSKLF